LVRLQLRDAFDNDIFEPLAKNISASLSNQPQVSVSVAYLLTGIYQLEYTPVITGPCRLSIRVDSIEIHGSPFALEVVSATLSVNNTIVFGPGTINATAGLPTFIVIALRDSLDNSIDTKAEIEVSITQMMCAVCSPTQVLSLPTTTVISGPGEYTVFYTPQLTAPTSLTVTVDAITVTSPPLHVAVAAGAVSPATSNTYGDGLIKAVAERPNVFYIQARDSLLNPVNTTAAIFAVEIYKGNISYDAAITPKGNGEYHVSYEAGDTREFTVAVSVVDSQGTWHLLKGFPQEILASTFLSSTNPVFIAAFGCTIIGLSGIFFGLFCIWLLLRFRRDAAPRAGLSWWQW
jgi:hypothetical protein